MMHRFVIAALVAMPAVAPAAPPTVNALYPAGARRGSTVEVQAVGAFERWPVKAHVEGSGVELRAGKDKGKLTATVAADAAPGVRWVRLYDEQGASALRPFLVGTLPEVNEQEPNNEPGKAQAVVALPVVVNGRLERTGDVDCFAVALKKGQTLVASVESHRTLGSPLDAVLQVVTPDGSVLAANHDYHGLDPHVVFAVPADGTYAVRVFGFPAEADASINLFGRDTAVYRLTLTTGAFAEHAWPLAVPRAAPGAVELAGWNLPRPAPRVPVPVTTGDAAIVWKDDVANSVSVRLEPHATAVEAEPNGTDRPQALTLPVTVSGRIDPPGDVDVYRVALKKSQAVIFRVESRALGFPLDAVLRVTDAAGKALAEQDDANNQPDPELTFTAPADGDYRVEVRDLHEHGGPRYAYLLRIAPPRPDFALKVAADQFTLTPGKPLEIPVTVERRAGFDQPIKVTVEGLPAGVTAEPVQSQPKGDKVTLKLSAKTGGGGGPVRVVGRAGELTRDAHAPAKTPFPSTAHLWLAVPK